VSRKPQRFFWKWSDGMYEFTGLYLFRGLFLGVVALEGRLRTAELRRALDLARGEEQ